MSSVTAAIQTFLADHTHKDLAALYSADMEVQVNVAADEGEPVADHRNTYSDGNKRWYSFRVPKNAKTEPHFDDYQLRFSLAEHAEAIGLTGWDWTNRCSRWVAFDFDAIVGHAEGIGVSDDELERVRTAAQGIPWVTVRTSTGGKGLHLYVFFANPPETKNHTEHAALGRAVLAQLSLAAGFDFSTTVDACGGNMWVWHRKMLGQDGALVGLQVLKQGEPLADIPANWHAHLEVVRSKRTKIRVVGITDSDEAGFELLAAGKPRAAIGVEHRRVMDWLGKNGHTSIWDQDHHLLTTHTSSLKAAHEALRLKGVFETIATGTQTGDHNCFCFPRPDGAWAVYRYSPGISEANTWQLSEQKWTFCHFNAPADLKSAALAFGGLRSIDDTFVFESADGARKAMKSLGAEFQVPPWISHRAVSLRLKKNEIVARVSSEGSDKAEDMRRLGWLLHKSKDWIKVFELAIDAGDEFALPDNLDDRIRHLVTPTLEEAGWAVLESKARWIDQPKSNVKSVLKSWDMSDKDSEATMGHLITHVWDLVNLPFQDEFPGERRWNRDGAKLAYVPSSNDGEMSHPNWDMVLEQCGSGLDEAVAESDWCQKNNVRTGKDYLQLWAAILFQRPTHPLPYLFFFSAGVTGQNTGKSAFHQALGLLMDKGYVEADSALINPQGFNKPLAGAILCYVEETDLSNARGTAYNRIKNWVTADNLSIHPKGLDPYMMPNTTHWVQCANRREACPIFAGDSRIVMVQVPPLPHDEIPWKEEMRPALQKQAPDFLRTLLDTQLPPPCGRLWLPVLETDAKREALRDSQDAPEEESSLDHDRLMEAVREFIAEMLYFDIEGQSVPSGRRMYWEGTFTTLAKLLGWHDTTANQISRALRQCRAALLEDGIEIVFPEEGQRTGAARKVTIAESCLILRQLSDEEMAADEDHCARLFDRMPLGV